jgi:hypothetical protein
MDCFSGYKGCDCMILFEGNNPLWQFFFEARRDPRGAWNLE